MEFVPAVLRFLNIGKTRWLTHLALALFSGGGAYLGHVYAPFAAPNYVFTIGFGYTALVLVALSLMIGPFKLLSQRRNPVNINLRRDVGIWSAITACLHVFFAFQLHKNGQILLYFLEPTPHGYRLIRSLFGVSNDLGAVATILLVILLVVSNDISLQRLKGKRWKTLQRWNYLLAALALAHTFGFQISSRREHGFTEATIVLTIVTLVIQLVGVYLYRSRSTRLMRVPEKT